jgi:RND superfamily putative drug exporter
VIVSLGLTGALLHGLSATGYATGATQSTRAAAAIDRAFPAAARAASTDVVIISSTRLEARATPFRAFVSELAGEIRSTPRVTSVTSYLNGDAALVSRDGHAALIQLRAADGSAVAPVVARVQAANGRDGFAVAITGEESVAHDFNTLGQRDLEHAELAIGLPAALIVLVLVFGSLVAALMPLVLAILSILVGLGLVALLAQVFALSSFVTNMLTGMGLALGIDYCLFILSRYREERTRGYVKVDAITRAGASASRAVLFSGTTFVVSMVGMLLVPTSVMRSLAAAAMIVGVVSVLAALTLLPALLSVLGDRVNALPVPVLGRNLGRAESAESALWRRIVGGVLRRPGLSLAVTATLMLAAAPPLRRPHGGARGGGARRSRASPLCSTPSRRATLRRSRSSRSAAGRRRWRPGCAGSPARSRTARSSAGPFWPPPGGRRRRCSRLRWRAIRSALARSPRSERSGRVTCRGPSTARARASGSAARPRRTSTTSTPSRGRRPTCWCSCSA